MGARGRAGRCPQDHSLSGSSLALIDVVQVTQTARLVTGPSLTGLVRTELARARGAMGTIVVVAIENSLKTAMRWRSLVTTR